ncbi:DUF1835 domain-containing protein [Aliiglaciecola sp. M165]|nr:DUF1835 domain-containing protein [Aliiglaciecola sp. M165]
MDWRREKMKRLHITNGDSTIDLLRAAGIAGEYLPWRDILHFGPVPMCEDLPSLSVIRADFLASMGITNQAALREDFAERDNKLNKAYDFDEIIFWFEHDLYDQLQIIQLFSWLTEHPVIVKKSTLVNPNKHLGHHTPEEAIDLLPTRRPITQQQLDVAKQAWYAFRQTNLEQWRELCSQITGALPYLKAAIQRSLGELPQPNSGCTQTEMMILELINRGENHAGPLFRSYCQLEQNEFHGDMSFFWIVEQMIQDTPPLLRKTQDVFELTKLGKTVLGGKQRWERQYSQQHWLGGYCISSPKRST